MPNNGSVLCAQLHNIVHECLNICSETLNPCLIEATEPSHGDAIRACEKFTKNCNDTCNQIIDFCLPKYPVNPKYHNGEEAIAAAVTLEAIIAYFILAYLAHQHGIRIEKKQNNLMLAIGQIFGLILGIFFTIKLEDFFAVPPLEKFEQRNPLDVSNANVITASCAIPAIVTSVAVCGVALDFAEPFLKRSMLHAYRACKSPRIQDGTEMHIVSRQRQDSTQLAPSLSGGYAHVATAP